MWYSAAMLHFLVEMFFMLIQLCKYIAVTQYHTNYYYATTYI